MGASPLGDRPGRRRARRSAADLGRFRRGRRRGEEFGAKLVQAVTLTAVCGALVWLEFSALRLLRARFLADYGPRAWLLPLGIGLLLLFLLYRLLRLWQELQARRRELRSEDKSLNSNDIE